MPSLAWKPPWKRRALGSALWKVLQKLDSSQLVPYSVNQRLGGGDCQEKKSAKGSHCRSQNTMRWSVIISQVLNVSSACARWLETGCAVIGWISWLWLISFPRNSWTYHISPQLLWWLPPWLVFTLCCVCLTDWLPVNSCRWRMSSSVYTTVGMWLPPVRCDIAGSDATLLVFFFFFLPCSGAYFIASPITFDSSACNGNSRGKIDFKRKTEWECCTQTVRQR